MILKGNQRGGGKQMALHLLNGEQNEHVTVHQVRGFIAEDVLGALNEAYAISKGTQCRKYMYSLSLNPPQTEEVEAGVFDKTLERIEKKLGLEGQPRVVVFHEKEGRRHAHCVWSRIDIDNMKAINISHDRLKLNSIAKSLYLEYGWTMPEGFRDKSKKSVFNFTREEWQQAQRVGRNAAEIKRELQECWAMSDCRKSFEHALKDVGYVLARGDKRSYVVVDLRGEIYSLPRQLGKKKADLEPLLGASEKLDTIKEARQKFAVQLSPLVQKYMDDLNAHHVSQKETLLQEKRSMTTHHRKIRQDLKAYQDKRWQAEEQKRAKRVRHGFKGLWDKLSGKYWKTRKQNEEEAYQCYLRDQKQKEEIIQKQLTQRQDLQNRILELNRQQDQERKSLTRDLSQFAEAEKYMQSHSKDKEQDITQEYDGPEMEM